LFGADNRRVKWQIDAPDWPLLFAAAAAATLFSAAGTALHAWAPALARIDAPVAEVPEALEEATAHAVRCPHCARIESKRELAPGMFEYTVRSSGGSRSVFEQALPTSWRVGERLMLIDGAVAEQ
jgi:hypothetical protein